MAIGNAEIFNNLIIIISVYSITNMDDKEAENFIMTLLKDKKEIKNNKSKVLSLFEKYKRKTLDGKVILFVASNSLLDKLFIIFLHYYNMYLVSGKINYVSIDLEFNKGDVALMQLNFGEYIWIINPQNYKDLDKKELNDNLFCNDLIHKILHGSDALDLHHIYKLILEDDKNKIIKFMHRWIDTRFLCEYLRTSQNEGGKCSIYDGMLYTNTIDKNLYDDLVVNTSIMRPGDDVMWNVEKLNDSSLKYAYSDVLYLTQFFRDICKEIKNKTPIYQNTYHYIFQIVRFITLERRNVTDIVQNAKNIIDKMNNYIIKEINNTIIGLYNSMMKEYIIKYDENGKELMIDIKFIQSINYSRTMFTVLLKYVFYYAVTNKYQVYINKKDQYVEKIDLNYLLNMLEEIGMKRIIKLLELYLKSLKF